MEAHMEFVQSLNLYHMTPHFIRAIVTLYNERLVVRVDREVGPKQVLPQLLKCIYDGIRFFFYCCPALFNLVELVAYIVDHTFHTLTVILDQDTPYAGV